MRRRNKAHAAKREEAECGIVPDALLAVYFIARLSQVPRIYRAHLNEEKFGAGAESLEVAPFSWEDIPWTEIAFPSVHWALHRWRETKDRAVFAPFADPPGQDGNFPER